MRIPAIAFGALLAASLPVAAAFGQATTPADVPPEEIGSWRLSCAVDRMTDRADCQLRHREPVERGAGVTPSLLLEIQNRGGYFVPVVTARDLTLEAAGRGLLALTGSAQLRFSPNPMFEMPCGLEGRSLVCAPRSEDLRRAADELPTAGTALVRMVGLTGPGSGSSIEPVELRLERTQDAIARYRTRAPEAPVLPAAPAPGLTLMEILQRLQRLLGT